MQKRNRDKLMEKPVYDLLVSMNEYLERNTHCVCVMECFMQSHDAEERCLKYIKSDNEKCMNCIVSWLNEEGS